MLTYVPDPMNTQNGASGARQTSQSEQYVAGATEAT